MSNVNEVAVVKAVEIAPTHQVVVTLTDAQFKALKRLDLVDEMQKIVANAAATAIRGKFKYMADKAEAETAKSYEWAIRSGGKFDKDKGSFVSFYMNEIRAILNEL